MKDSIACFSNYESECKDAPLPFADVAICARTPLRQAFTYAVPEGMRVHAGQPVFVPFGSDVLHGIVLRLRPDSDVDGVRPIEAPADDEPLIDPTRARLAEWMADYFLAPLWECVAACLPPGYGNRPVTMVSAVDVPALLPPSAIEQRILNYVAERERVQLDTLTSHVRGATEADLRRLQERGYLTATRGLTRPTGRPRFQQRVRLATTVNKARERAEEFRSASSRPSVAARILDMLSLKHDVSRAELAKGTGATAHWLDRLEADGLLEQYEVQLYRAPEVSAARRHASRPGLTSAQAAAVEAINQGGRFLLHGVTGAGKTEVYLRAVEHALAQGKSAIVLVPEISLTPQAIQRFGERVGATLAVMHSGLGTGERYDQWHAIRRGDLRVVLGSRSAIFAPARDLGLVIIDEEHEPSYKQDSVPRYHARTVAKKLCDLTGATLVLGSATPDIETYARSEWGEITRVEMPERIYRTSAGHTERGSPPAITVIDMRREMQEGNRSTFSRGLSAAVRRALEDGEQSLLFVNRRGTARFVLCRDCGFVASCRSCEIAFSLSAESESAGRMVCHGCGRTQAMPARCPRCTSPTLRPFGVGTERVEQLARQAFPGARVTRWDLDTSRRKGAHEDLLRRVEIGDVDILVGTQMVAKGLDLPAMRVVGVVDADVGLHLPDFRAHERAYQLLTQVAGRAGRRDRPGNVIIQTYSPEHPAIQWAAANDYRGFYDEEIEHRRLGGYPPFARLARLTYAHRSEQAGLRQARELAASLRDELRRTGDATTEVRGPAPAFMARVSGRYRWTLLVRGERVRELVEPVAGRPGWSIDIDPVSTG